MSLSHRSLPGREGPQPAGEIRSSAWPAALSARDGALVRGTLLASSRGRPPIASPLLADLRAHLEQRPGSGASEVARRFGMSQRTFQRRLHELGTSFQQEVNGAHLKIATRLMQETSHSLKWIAIESGYASLQHFSSSFRARSGLSPSAWRARRSV